MCLNDTATEQRSGKLCPVQVNLQGTTGALAASASAIRVMESKEGKRGVVAEKVGREVEWMRTKHGG